MKYENQNLVMFFIYRKNEQGVMICTKDTQLKLDFNNTNLIDTNIYRNKV